MGSQAAGNVIVDRPGAVVPVVERKARRMLENDAIDLFKGCLKC